MNFEKFIKRSMTVLLTLLSLGCDEPSKSVEKGNDGKMSMALSLLPAKQLGIIVDKVNIRLDGPIDVDTDLQISEAKRVLLLKF